MTMQKVTPAANPAAYVAALDGWRKTLVTRLRTQVRATADFEEIIKWGHIVYRLNGPVLLIRAEDERVLFGFWHGQRLRDIEPRLKPGGKYEMATLDLRAGDPISSAIARRLATTAAALNQTLGDPSDAAGTR